MKSIMRLPAISLCSAVVLLMPQVVRSAEADVQIRLRPHCETAACSEFVPYDADALITNGLKKDDMLDIDIVLKNPSGQSLQSVQSWLEYDATILKGVDVRISDTFPLVAPGEQAFAEASGLVKLGASNVSGGMKEPEAVFARVKFQVIKEPDDQSVLKFNQFSLLGQEGKTKVLLVEGGRTVNVLKTRPKDLRLYFGDDPPPSLLPTQPNIPNVPNQPTQPPISDPTFISDPSFSRLQPQGLRIMTEGDKVYLIWSPLNDPRVVGYNIYYGTVSGRYIQRRTLSMDTTGVTISNLPVGTKYYFAVAAFSAQGQDSDYSYEVAVIVGDSASSTAPFTLAPSDTGSSIGGSVIPPSNGQVSGGTGMPFIALIVISGIALCATGTSWFLRRRFQNAS